MFKKSAKNKNKNFIPMFPRHGTWNTRISFFMLFLFFFIIPLRDRPNKPGKRKRLDEYWVSLYAWFSFLLLRNVSVKNLAALMIRTSEFTVNVTVCHLRFEWISDMRLINSIKCLHPRYPLSHFYIAFQCTTLR